MKTILQLPHHEAKKYFLTSEAYFTGELPEYFTFDNLLLKVDGELNIKDIPDKFYREASRSQNVNHNLLTSKDGNLSWRNLELIHPVIYVAIVQQLTKEVNWRTITEKLAAQIFFCKFGLGCCLKGDCFW